MFRKICICPVIILTLLLPIQGWVLSSEITPGISSVKEDTSTYYLSLDETTRLAIQNNFAIQLAQYDARIAKAKLGESQSIYDTLLNADVKYRNDQGKQTSTILGSKIIDNDYNLGVSKKLPSGTTLTTNMTNHRNWSNSSFTTSSPSHDSTLKLGLKQELGKNFFGLQDRGDVTITKIDIENSQYSSLENIEDDLAQVQKAYWDIVLHREKVTIALETQRQAKTLFNLDEDKIKRGLVEAPELIASEANFQTRLNEVLLAKDELESKVNVLKLLLNIPDNEAAIVPSESFVLSTQDQSVDQALQLAFTNRYDYKKTLNDIESKKIKLTMKKTSLWPEINLEASLARNGLGDHFPSAVTNITVEDNPDFFTGLTVKIPWENRKAESQLKAAQLEKAKALLNLKWLERKITIGIVDKVRRCQVLKELALNSQNIAGLQTWKLEEEQKRLATGRSNTDTVIRYQEDLLKAKWKAAEAMFEYQSALIDLRKQEGTLLNEYWGEERL